MLLIYCLKEEYSNDLSMFDVNKLTMAQRKQAVSIKRFAENLFGEKNTSMRAIIYSMIVLLAISWFPDGISAIFEYNLSEKGLFLCSYKLLFSLFVFGCFGVFLFRAGKIDNGKLAVDRNRPQEVVVLGVFLSTLARTKVESKSIEDSIQAAMVNSSFTQGIIDGRPWEMPLKAIEYHKGTLKNLFVFTSNGENGTTLLMPLFIKVVNQLYPALIVKEVYAGGMDFESIEDVFANVELFYTQAAQVGCKEQDILVDITGGQKTNSIAAAVATLLSGREFQYISTGTKDVMAYDVRYIEKSES